jgi:hypothetical protein
MLGRRKAVDRRLTTGCWALNAKSRVQENWENASEIDYVI